MFVLQVSRQISPTEMLQKLQLSGSIRFSNHENDLFYPKGSEYLVFDPTPRKVPVAEFRSMFKLYP